MVFAKPLQPLQHRVDLELGGDEVVQRFGVVVGLSGSGAHDGVLSACSRCEGASGLQTTSALTRRLINGITGNIIALMTSGAAMDGMSEREYSCHSGLSRGAIQNAKPGGRLVFYTDGSINAAASDARRVEMTDPDQQRRSLGGDAAIPTGGGGGSDR
jgi:hypothetical protein